MHNAVILHAHPVRGESHNQRNTTGVVATVQTAAGIWDSCFAVHFVIHEPKCRDLSLSSVNICQTKK